MSERGVETTVYMENGESFTGWLFGRTPWLTLDSSYLLFVPFILVNVTGLLTASHRVHAALVVIALVMSVLGLAFSPANTYIP